MSRHSRRFLLVCLGMLAKGGKGSGNFHHKGRKGKRGGSAPDEDARLIEATLKAHALPWRHLEFSDEAWRAEFPDGTVHTPIGVVKLGDRQHEKLRDRGRSRYFGLIRPTLEDPAYAISTLETDEQMAVRNAAGETPARASKLEFIRAFIKPDGKHQGFLCVTIGRDDIEISVSSGPRRVGELAKKVKRGAILLELPRQDQPQTLGVEDSYAKAATYSQFTRPLLKSNPDALALDLLAKASQLGLFEQPVQVKPHVRKGKAVQGFTRVQKKRLPPARQSDLFGEPEARSEAARMGRLGHFVEKHGGYRRLLSLLESFSPAQKDALLASMAKLANKTPAAILDMLKTGARHEGPSAKQDDLFSEPSQDARADGKAGKGSDLSAVKREDEPKEGDTKTEGGIEYRLQDGRWHRAAPEEKPAFTPTHELPDGAQVVAHAEEPNVWVDAQGDEYESEEAYPIDGGGAGGNAPPTGGRSGGNDDSEPPNPMPDDDPHWSHAENIKHGKDAIHDVAEQHSDVTHAMFREELGWVDFVYGDVGDPPNAKGKRKGAKGVAHIIEARMRKDGMTYQQAMRLLDNVVVTIDVGDISTSRYYDPKRDAHGTKAIVAFKGIEAVLIRDDGANSWLMTGYEKREAEEELPSVGSSEGGVSTGPTLAGPTTPRPGEGAEGRLSVVPDDKNDNPQEGERNAEGLVFRDGRWHREDDPEARTAAIDDQLDQEEAQRLNPPETTPEPEPEPTRPDPIERLRSQIEAMGGKAQVAENLRMAFKDRSTRPQAEAVINGLADATGLDRDTVLAEMGIREVTRKPPVERSRPDTLSTGGDYSDDDPNSPNYRFRDTGYIGDSRKELAADSIREHARNGQRLRATDIDWEEIERNPRQAKELITKSNLFGKVDWDALKANGMEPATGFLIDRVYASIAPEPSGDDAQARKDYAVGLESLRDRLESCKTPQNVTDVLKELRDEYDGIIFNESEKAAYERALAIQQEISNRRWELKKELDALQQAAHRINGKISGLSWEQEKRERRKWKRDPEVDKQIEALRPEQEAAIQAVQDWKAAHPEAEERYEQASGTDAQGNQHVRMRLRGELYEQEQKAGEVLRLIRDFALARNRQENPLHRAWQLMGPKFLAVLKWRSGKNAFQGHVTRAKTGKITDWSWAEKQHVTAPRATAGKVRFQLRVAEQFSRVGGRPVEVNSTDELKRRYGLRDVQSGNWVLTDPESAAFHVQHAAEALSDLSDLLGIPEDKLFVNGRVALAFGARGTGNAGFGGGSRAHYERIHRVINLTKLGGGGALAHELFHAIDNLAKEAETGQPGDSEDFITENPGLLPEGRLKNAVRNFRSAMLEGDKRMWQTLKYSAQDARNAKYNLDRASPSKMAAAIKDAPDLESALLAIDGFYPRGWDGKRTTRQREDWRRIAAAWHGGMNPEGGKAKARAGAPVSDFTYQAHLLDSGQYGKYWSTTREMAARAFQAWCEDRLSDQGRKNDYLSAFADNQYYKDPLFGDSKPFPEGQERERINTAIDELVAALREGGTLRKAFELLAA